MILFGGTFDPLHNGHLHIANTIYKLFDQQIVFIPTNTPTYKKEPTTTNQQRLDMLKNSIEQFTDKRFVINTIELNEVGYSCTYDTLNKLRKQYGNKTPLNFIIGSDSLTTLDKWDNWQQLFNLTNFIVATRPNYNIQQMSEELQYQCQARITNDINKIKTTDFGTIYLLNYTPMDISSTAIRQLITQQQEISHLVPHVVKQYIQQHNLYKNGD